MQNEILELGEGRQYKQPKQLNIHCCLEWIEKKR